MVHGSIFRFEGQATVFNPYQGPCYRCMIPEPPPAELAPSCAEAGVLGVLPGIVGSIQALEAIKLHPRPRRLAAVDGSWPTTRWSRASGRSRCSATPDCPACSIDPDDIVIAEYDELCMPHRAH